MAMACQVICISRSLGAGGEEIGRTVAKELRFRYADEEIIIRAAEKAGVSPESVAKAEHTPGVIARILESMARTPMDLEVASAYAMTPHTLPGYEGLIEAVIRETASEGKVVIVAHGASIPLAGMRGLLRVLVTASPAARIARLAREANLAEGEAKKAIRESDRQRREYLRRFYNVPHELPTHYDLVVNTEFIALPQAAQVVLSAAPK